MSAASVLLLQADRRTAALFVRHRFGERELRYWMPPALALLTSWAAVVWLSVWPWVVVWLWPRLSGQLTPAEARTTPVPPFPLPDPRGAAEVWGWVALGALVLLVGSLHCWGTLRRMWRRQEIGRYAPGTPFLMRFSRGHPRTDPRRWVNDWNRAELVGEPLIGAAAATLAWQVSAGLGTYVAICFLLLWKDAVRMARARRADRLTFQEALMRQRYQEFMLAEAVRSVGEDQRAFRNTFTPLAK